MRSDWSFLGGDFAVQTVSIKTVQAVYFCFKAKPVNSKFATNAAEKCENCHFSKSKYQKKAKNIEILSKFRRWMKKTSLLRGVL